MLHFRTCFSHVFSITNLIQKVLTKIWPSRSGSQEWYDTPCCSDVGPHRGPWVVPGARIANPLASPSQDSFRSRNLRADAENRLERPMLKTRLESFNMTFNMNKMRWNESTVEIEWSIWNTLFFGWRMLFLGSDFREQIIFGNKWACKMKVLKNYIELEWTSSLQRAYPADRLSLNKPDDLQVLLFACAFFGLHL